MMRRLIVAIAIIIICLTCWYLFIRSYDVRVKFKAKTLPDIALATFKTWQTTMENDTLSIDLEKHEVLQEVHFNNSLYTIKWDFNYSRDSSTTVYAAFSKGGGDYKTRIRSLFGTSDLEKDATNLVRDYSSKLKEHLSKVRVVVKGMSTMREQKCLCISLKTDQFGKAMGMMQNYGLLSDFIIQKEVEVVGRPLVEVVDWDESADVLAYNFCFPIKEEVEVDVPVFFNRTLPETEVIKAEYYGNYISSDRAWYALLDYAEKKELSILKKPLEIFYNNPNFEKNEENWKAEVMLPLKKN